MIVPMGYPANNAAYIDEVRQSGLALFSPDNLQILSDKLALTTTSPCCASAIWATSSRAPAGDWYAVSADPGWRALCAQSRQPVLAGYGEQHIPVLFTTDDLNEEVVREAQRQLTQVDKNAIGFSPNYLTPWHQALGDRFRGESMSQLQFSGLLVIWLLSALVYCHPD